MLCGGRKARGEERGENYFHVYMASSSTISHHLLFEKLLEILHCSQTITGDGCGVEASGEVRSVPFLTTTTLYMCRTKASEKQARHPQCMEKRGRWASQARRDEEKAKLGAESMEWEMMILSNGLNIAPRRRTFGLFANENRKIFCAVAILTLGSLNVPNEGIYFLLRWWCETLGK
jgi:hypothetical protein